MSEEENKNMLLFFNIGNRDVKIEGEIIPKEEVRSKGKEILDNYDSISQKLNFELVSPLLENFKQKVNKVFLFVTDQSDPEYRKQDTLFFGRIIQRFIEERGMECEVKEYPWNPTDYNLTFHFFTTFFKDFDDSSTKIISTSGGVPAMKFAMQIVASSLFNNVEFYSVDEKTHEVKTVDIENTLKKELVKRAAIELLKRHDYAGIINLLESNGIENRKLRLLLEYAHSRLCFNFENANTRINGLIDSLHSIEKEEYEKLKIDFLDKNVLFNELFQNMVIKWENGEYVDFIGRLYTFREILLQMIFEMETNTKNKIDWQNIEKGNKQLTEILKNYPYIEQKIRSELKIPTEEIIKTTDDALRICFSSFVEKAGERLGPIWDIYKKTDKLVKLRHLTIVGHSTKGVSKDKIKNCYMSGSIIEDLREIVNKLSEGRDVFKEINAILDKHIKGI